MWKIEKKELGVERREGKCTWEGGPGMWLSLPLLMRKD